MDRIAPVSPAAATRPLQSFGGGLTVGQVVHARVAKVDGDTVQLRLGDQTVAVATKVPLTVGQQVNLMVEEGTAGKMLLRLVDDVFTGTLRQARPEMPGSGRGSTTTTTGTTPAPGRELPVTGVQGRAPRDTGGSSHGQSAEGGEQQDWSGTGPRLGVNGAQARLAGLGTPELGPRIASPAGQGLPTPGPGVPNPNPRQTPGTLGQTPGTLGQAPGSSGHLFGMPGQQTGTPDLTFGPSGQPPAIPGQAAGASGQAPGLPGRAPGATGQTFSALNPTLNGLWLAGANAAARLGPAGTTRAGQNGAGTTGTAPTQPGPANQASTARGGLPASGAAGTLGAGVWTPGAGARQTIGAWTQIADTWVQGTGASPQGTGARTPGQPTRSPAATESDPLATVLFEKLDGSATRLAGSARTRTSDLLSGTVASRFGAPARSAGQSASQPTTGHEHVARAALPAYGRLAQSVGGSVAFGQLMAALPREVGETLARAPLAPADLGRLLIDVGVHPDEMNAVLVGELLAQKVPVQEATVRLLRRELAVAGGTPGDAASAVALARLGLPITPLSLAIARQMLAGQLDPPAAWGELLPALQRVARFAGRGSQAGMLAAELVSDWQVPVSDGPEAVAEWLRTTLDQTGTPLEAKLARAFLADGEQRAGAAASQDVRARLDLLAQALPPVARPDRDSLGQALLRLQATVQAEQLLNAASAERAEPRYFAVTLPTVLHQQPGTLQVRVREREARPRAPGEVGRPDVVQLKLSLPGLGELGVNLTVGQHSVACHFAAGSAFAESLLTASSRELVGRLKELGYTHTTVDAAHEPPEPIESPLIAAPRVSRVDVQA